MLSRKATYFTPDLIFEEGVLRVSGKLWMENPAKYFDKIFRCTVECEQKEFLVILEVSHLNSSSIKQLLEYLFLLRDFKDQGKFVSVSIVWFTQIDDKDLRELIQDLQRLTGLEIAVKVRE